MVRYAVAHVAGRYPECFRPAPDRQAGAREEIVSTLGAAAVGVVVPQHAPPKPQSVGEQVWPVRPWPGTKETIDVDEANLRRRPWFIERTHHTVQREIRLSEEWSKVRVRIAPSAREAMVRSARDSMPNESGGLAFSVERPLSFRPISIAEITLPGPNSEASPESFRFDADHDAQTIEDMRALGYHFVGTWHSHDDVDYPSPPDLAQWGSLRGAFDLPLLVGVIVVLAERGARDVRAWVVTESKNVPGVDLAAPAFTT